MGSVLALDLATRKTGWCAGDGASVPVAGAWLFNQVGEAYGRLGAAMWFNLDSMALRYPDLELVLVEAPILKPGDKLDTLRKLYGMSFTVETWCALRGIRCAEAGVKRIKKELAGLSHASKTEMVVAAEKCGVVLPPTKADGKEDAADAFGGWLIGLRAINRPASAQWDRRLWSSRNTNLI